MSASTYLLKVLGLLSLATRTGNDMTLPVEGYRRDGSVINLTCSEDQPRPDNATFRTMQIIQIDETGKLLPWVTLNEMGHTQIPPDFTHIIAERNYTVTGTLTEVGSQLQILVYDPVFDVHRWTYGKFSCLVQYRYRQDFSILSKKKEIGNILNIIPGFNPPKEDEGFVVRLDHVVELACRATVQSQNFTLSITRMSDESVVASWGGSQILACSPRAVCSDLQVIKEKGVVYAKVQLVGVSDLGSDYKCIVKTSQETNKALAISMPPDQPCKSDTGIGAECTIAVTFGNCFCFLLGCLVTAIMSRCHGQLDRGNDKYNIVEQDDNQNV